MKLEHVAINVPEPFAMADWYVKNLGLKIVSQKSTAPFITFLADDSDRVMLEFYKNENAAIPDYKNQNSLTLHIAFITTQPNEDIKRLLNNGATLESDDIWKNGSRIIVLRDPWGLAIQLCKRTEELLPKK